LCLSHKPLPSILQRLWDERGQHSRICLVLCGSYVSFMEREVLAHKSPLYGRRTGQLLVEPLPFGTLRDFLPRYGPTDRVRVYAIAGGVPAYLMQFSDARSLEKNLETTVLGPTALLREEVRFVLTEELRDPKQYFSVLETISFGNTRLNEIVQHTGLDRGPVSKYLAVLQELRIVEREVPVTEPAPHKSRKGIYRISDPFFRFWFRFVNAYRSELVDRGPRHVLDSHILPNLDLFIGQAFDYTCRDILRDLVNAGKVAVAYDRLGRHWDRQMELDLVGMKGRAPVLVGECKWSRKPVGQDILAALRQKALRLAGSGPRCWHSSRARDLHRPSLGSRRTARSCWWMFVRWTRQRRADTPGRRHHNLTSVSRPGIAPHREEPLRSESASRGIRTEAARARIFAGCAGPRSSPRGTPTSRRRRAARDSSRSSLVSRER
ncbi:MAG: ATP-binding protein, partial [Armatimonadota bacterium]